MGQLTVGLRARDSFVLATTEPDNATLEAPSGIVPLGRVCLLVEQQDLAKHLALTAHLRMTLASADADAGFDALSLKTRDSLLALHQADPTAADACLIHVVGTDPQRFGGWHYSSIQAADIAPPGGAPTLDVTIAEPHGLSHDVLLTYGQDALIRFLCQEVNPAQLDVRASVRLATIFFLEGQLLGWLPPAISVGWFDQQRQFRFATPSEVLEIRRDCTARLSRAVPAFARLMAEMQTRG